MIVIINQHYGTWTELEAHVNNYISHVESSNWFMVLLIDHVTDRDVPFIESYIKKWNSECITSLYVCFSSKIPNQPLGLSQCRYYAMRFSELNLNTMNNVTHYFFGCTNSTWNYKLNDKLHDMIIEAGRGSDVIVSDCDYTQNEWNDWTHQFHDQKHIKVSELINCDSRPDMSIIISTGLYRKYQDKLLNPFIFKDEKYFPEDLIWYYGSRDDMIAHLRIQNGPQLQTAWYNAKGMSKTFSRNTVLANRGGFFTRAAVLLQEWECNRILLSTTTVKHLTYDLVTLSDTIPFKQFEGTIVEPIMWWSLNKWVKNKEYNHQLIFKE